MYSNYLKRLMDMFFSVILIIVLSPIIIILSVLGCFVLKGNPFFIQKRPGLNGKVFNLIKFRTMTNRVGVDGTLLPDEERMTSYGTFLRKTSLDEVLELINIVKGDMSFVGPRPLLVRYLDRYNEKQRHRHDVRPGLTGLAQVNGRNALTWEEKFDMDVWYTKNVTFLTDIKIIIKTFSVVLKREGISSEFAATMEEFMGSSMGSEEDKK